MINYSVLFVDDEPGLCAGFEIQYGKSFKVFTCTNTHDAYEKLIAEPNIAVVVSDQRMGHAKEGTEFLTKVKELYPQKKIFIQTENLNIDDLIFSVNSLKIDGYLSKLDSSVDDVRSQLIIKIAEYANDQRI